MDLHTAFEHIQLQQTLQHNNNEKDGDQLFSELSTAQHDVRREKVASRWVLVLSYVTLVVIGSLTVITFSFAIKYHSDAALVFSFDGILDCVDTIVVMWRFSSCGGGPNNNVAHSARREYIGCIVLSILCFMSAIGLFVKSTISVTDIFERVEAVDTLWIISLVNGVVCTLLAVGKFYLSYILKSLVVFTDGVGSAIGAVLAFASLASVFIIQSYARAWIMDPIFGYICVVFFASYGAWLLCSQLQHHGIIDL